MLEFSQKAIRFMRGRNRSDLDSDEVLALAITHLIEVTGEAASHLSPDLCDQHPEIPWNLVVGTRNRIAHGYTAVDNDIIWAIVTRDLPPLVRDLKRLRRQLGD